MNESTVSMPLIKKLRLRFPEAEIVKVHDGSTIGLPDLSVTYRGGEFKFEFKLWTPLHGWDMTSDGVPCEKIAAESPLQLEIMRRYSRAAKLALYIIWVRKSKCVVLWDPNHPLDRIAVSSTSLMVNLVAYLIEERSKA